MSIPDQLILAVAIYAVVSAWANTRTGDEVFSWLWAGVLLQAVVTKGAMDQML